MKVKCSSEDCIYIKNNYCTLEEIELDRLACTNDKKEITFDDYCFECLDYSDGNEESITNYLKSKLGI